MKHCPICNASSDERRFFGEFCENCAAEALSRKLPGGARILVCKECGRVRLGRRFVPFDAPGRRAVLLSIFRGCGAEPMGVRLGEPVWRVRITDDRGLSFTKEIRVDYEKTLCDSCTRRHGGYWEAMVQFRGSPERIDALIAALDRYLDRRSAFISKVVDTDTGVDAYASDKKLVQAFLTERNIRYTKSFTLHGQRGSRKLYRNTYSVAV